MSVGLITPPPFRAEQGLASGGGTRSAGRESVLGLGLPENLPTNTAALLRRSGGGGGWGSGTFLPRWSSVAADHLICGAVSGDPLPTGATLPVHLPDQRRPLLQVQNVEIRVSL